MEADTQTVTGVPVLIIGGGPVGLATSVLLSRHGVRSILAERHAGVSTHPRAHVVNTRTMELFRQWGLEGGVRAKALRAEAVRCVIWTSTLAGEELGRIDLREQTPERIKARTAASANSSVSCAQDEVESLMREIATASSHAEVSFATEVTDLRLLDDSVEADLRSSVDGSVRRVRARYVVAADGASSPTRERLGIPMSGISAMSHLLNVYFHADLKPWLADRPAGLYWTVNQTARGVFVAMDDERRWTFNGEFHPERGETLADYTPERAAACVRAAVGVDDVDIDVRSVKTWTMANEVADRYRQGNVFLVGDAAHRFPPTGGLGMNTGVADAHNLAWKLAAVLQGWASSSILDTYQVERRPIAVTNGDQSLVNAMRMGSTGVGPDAERVAEVLAAGGPAADLERERLAGAIAEQVEHFDYLNQELGYHYGGSPAVVPDGTPEPTPADPVRDFEPSARPGARAPHVWLASEEGPISIVDLLHTEFVLVSRPDRAWADAVVSVGGDGPPVRHLAVAHDDDIDGTWQERYGVDTGAVLVRPDGHVAWRVPERPVDPAGALKQALQSVLFPTDPSDAKD